MLLAPEEEELLPQEARVLPRRVPHIEIRKRAGLAPLPEEAPLFGDPSGDPKRADDWYAPPGDPEVEEPQPRKPLVFDDTAIDDAPAGEHFPKPGDALRYHQELQGAIPDDLGGFNKPPEVTPVSLPPEPELEPPQEKTREEYEDEFDQPYQVAGKIPNLQKGIGNILHQRLNQQPPPGMGHNQGPPLPPGGGLPPPPTGGAPPPIVPTPPSGSKIVYGLGDDRAPDIHDAYTQVFDDLHPLKRLQTRLNEISELGDEEKFYELGRLTRGSFGRSHQAIANATFDFNTLQNNGMGLKDVLHGVKNDLRGFDEYARAKRTVELHGRGINSGQPVAEAQNIINAAPQSFRDALPALHNYQDRILQYVRDSGLLSDQGYNAIKAANKEYVPLHRDMEMADLASATTGSLKTRNPIHAIKGSDRDVLSPIETIVRNTHSLMDLAEKNRALNALVDAADVRGVTGPNGLVQKVPNSIYPVKRDEILVYKNGKAERYKVDPEVATAVNGMGAKQVELAIELAVPLTNKTVKLSPDAPAKWLRAGATLSPDFLTKNPARDQMVAAVLSKNGFIPVVDYFRGLGHMLGNTQKYQDWLKSGGANSAVVSMDRKYIEEELKNIMKSGAWDQIKNSVMHPIEFLGKMSEYGEQPTRVAEFIKAANPGFIRGAFGAQGKSTHMAGFDSREVTTDFGRHGASQFIQGWNKMTAFQNPQLQGVDRFARAVKDNPFATAFKIAATTTLPTLAIYHQNRQDPRMMDVPRWERDLFWHWPTDDWQEVTAAEAKQIPKGWQKTEDGKTFVNLGTIYKFPKSFEIGVTFGSTFERALDAYFKHDPDAWKDFDKTMRHTWMAGGLPTIAVPVAEAKANYSIFRDRDLVTKRIANPTDRRFEYDNYTSDTAKLIGSAWANISPTSQFASPKVIENYVYGWTATLGRYAMMTADAALHTVAPKKGQPYPAWKGVQAGGYEAPAWGPADMPVLRSWVSRMPATYTQPVSDFFENYTGNLAAKSTTKRMTKGGQETPEDKGQANLRPFATAIGLQFQMIEMIQNASNIPAEDKRKLIEQRSLSIMMMAQNGNKVFEATKAKLKKP